MPSSPAVIAEALAALLVAANPSEASLVRPAVVTAGAGCGPATASPGISTLRRLVRHGCDREAVAFVTGELGGLSWADRLAALGIAAEVPAGESRLGPERLALTAEILARLGTPPAEGDAAHRAALTTEALFTVACLQRERPAAGTLGRLVSRFAAEQRPDATLAVDLVALRRIYLRWRYRADCPDEAEEAIEALRSPEL